MSGGARETGERDSQRRGGNGGVGARGQGNSARLRGSSEGVSTGTANPTLLFRRPHAQSSRLRNRHAPLAHVITFCGVTVSVHTHTHAPARAYTRTRCRTRTSTQPTISTPKLNLPPPVNQPDTYLNRRAAPLDVARMSRPGTVTGIRTESPVFASRAGTDRPVLIGPGRFSLDSQSLPYSPSLESDGPRE